VEQLDLNKDGAASKTEIMQEFDSNNDGTISSREFAQHTLETPGKQRLRIQMPVELLQVHPNIGHTHIFDLLWVVLPRFHFDCARQ
jgi:hypothetical protein